MKKLLLPVVLLTTSLGFFAFKSELTNLNQFHKSPLNGGGSPAARTGAPGEQNCTACHSGSTQAGTTENVFTVLDANNNPVSSYILGETYTVNLAMASNPAKKGFQSTVLSASNAMAGNFTAGTTTQINTSTVSGGQRKYANHKSTSNSNSTPLWSWTWTAPATNVGDVTFYVTSNKANGNNNDNGDVIYLSQHVITAPSTAGIEENEFKSFFKASYNSEKNGVQLNFNSLKADRIHINVVDLTGKSVIARNIGIAKIGENSEFVSFANQLPKGYYVVNMFLNNKALSSKIVVQ
jgi:hypothetical protein